MRNEPLNLDASEQELIEAARNGDRDAFRQLTTAHLGHAWRIAWRILRQPEWSQEVVRETFLAAHRTLPAFSGDPKFSLWLTRIVVTRAVKLLERMTLHRRVEQPLEAPTPAALANMAGNELIHRLEVGRLSLDGTLRAALILREVEALSSADVELVLQIAPEAARRRLARARFGLWRAVSGQTAVGLEDAEAEELASGSLDGTLSNAEKHRLEKELESDPALRGRMEEVKKLHDLLAKDQAPAVPVNLLDQVLEGLPAPEVFSGRLPRRPVAPSGRPFPWRAVVTWTLVTIIGLGLVYVAFNQGMVGWVTEKADAVLAWAHKPAEPKPPAPPATEPAAGGSASQPAAQPASGTTTAPANGTAPEPITEEKPAATSTPTTAPPAATNPTPEAAPAGNSPAPTGSTPTPTAPSQLPSAPLVETSCTVVWPSPAGVLGWSGNPPDNPPLRLGLLAKTLGGRGLLDPGPPARVLITVPRNRWSELLDGLRSFGVAVTDSTPPPVSADCGKVVVTVPGV